MIHRDRFLARTLAMIAIAAALFVEPLRATLQTQPPIVEATRARVRALQASNSRVEITRLDGTRLRGRIIQSDDDSLTVLEEKPSREVGLQYAQVMEIKKIRLSSNTKTAIVAIIGGTVLAVLCFAPFPLGFLCQEDPS